MILSSWITGRDRFPGSAFRSWPACCAAGGCPSGPTAWWWWSGPRETPTTEWRSTTPTAVWGRCAATAPGASAGLAMNRAWPVRSSGWRPPQAWWPERASTGGPTGCGSIRPQWWSWTARFRWMGPAGPALMWSWAIPECPMRWFRWRVCGPVLRRSCGSWGESCAVTPPFPRGRTWTFTSPAVRTRFTCGLTSGGWRISPMPAAPGRAPRWRCWPCKGRSADGVSVWPQTAECWSLTPSSGAMGLKRCFWPAPPTPSPGEP